MRVRVAELLWADARRQPRDRKRHRLTIGFRSKRASIELLMVSLSVLAVASGEVRRVSEAPEPIGMTDLDSAEPRGLGALRDLGIVGYRESPRQNIRGSPHRRLFSEPFYELFFDRSSWRDVVIVDRRVLWIRQSLTGENSLTSYTLPNLSAQWSRPIDRNSGLWTDGEHIYERLRGVVSRIEPSTGRLLFSLDLKDEYPLQILGFGGKLFLPEPTGVACVDAATGRVEWIKTLEKKDPDEGGPSILSVGPSVVLGMEGGLVGLDPSSGEERWRLADSARWIELPRGSSCDASLDERHRVKISFSGQSPAGEEPIRADPRCEYGIARLSSGGSEGVDLASSKNLWTFKSSYEYEDEWWSNPSRAIVKRYGA